jgi:hypothetical protein
MNSGMTRPSTEHAEQIAGQIQSGAAHAPRTAPMLTSPGVISARGALNWAE